MAASSCGETRDTDEADLAAHVGKLTALEHEGMNNAVLRDLETAHTREMRNIVQALHGLRYEPAHSPDEQLLAVQGGPGPGGPGTTVAALQRDSWLRGGARSSRPGALERAWTSLPPGCSCATRSARASGFSWRPR